MDEVKVYRNGPLAVGEHSTAVRSIWRSIDAFAPINYTRRLDSIFAAPDINGVLRWVKSKYMYDNCFGGGRDLTTHEITVLNPDTLFVHSISDYDAIVRCFRINTSQIDVGRKTESELFDEWAEGVSLMESYWANAICLSDWEKTSTAKNLDSSEWEILVPVGNIASAEKLSDESLLDYCPTKESRHELSSLFTAVRLQHLAT